MRNVRGVYIADFFNFKACRDCGKHKGAQGGYVLARDPSQITVGEILTVLEGPLAPVPCIAEKTKRSKSSCERYENCTARSFWEKIMNTLNDVANSITVEDLVKCYNSTVSQNTELEYYI